MSAGGEGHVEVRDQDGRAVTLSNDKIDVMQKYIFMLIFCREEQNKRSILLISL